MQRVLLKALQITPHTFLFMCNPFWEWPLLRLSATLGLCLTMTISNVFSSILNDLKSPIATPLAKPQDSLPVGSIFYFF